MGGKMKKNLIIRDYEAKIKINKTAKWFYLAIFITAGIVFLIKIPQYIFIGIIFIFIGIGLFLLSVLGCRKACKILDELKNEMGEK